MNGKEILRKFLEYLFLIVEKGIADVFQGKLRKFSRCSSSKCERIIDEENTGFFFLIILSIGW